MKFRDGLEYQGKLEAIHQIVNKIMNQESLVNQSTYMMWLDVFRGIHKEEDQLLFNKNVPQAFKTKAWAMKDVETELSSWSQLRHDTVLYVEEPYGAYLGCDYPDAYVDPRPAAWNAIRKMANALADSLDLFHGTKTVHSKVSNKKQEGHDLHSYFEDEQKNSVAHFRNFGYIAQRLADISEKQLRDEKQSEQDTLFLKSIVHDWKYSSGVPYGATGWYNELFLKGIDDSKNWNPVVSDVFTVPPDPAFKDDTMKVLTEGVGNINTMYLALDFVNGKKIMFVGPVYSHYEFYQSSRMSDSEWRQSINNYQTPPHPEWTREYLVPGINPESPGYVKDTEYQY
ncbi:hypothetical protein AKO1_003440 [Acrasis kona]|uniref:Uncharacterized protein n=1 Tax=Acrasis kona TaxID=1008807 RepID=A0AAW2Z5L0_9EUKA